VCSQLLCPAAGSSPATPSWPTSSVGPVSMCASAASSSAAAARTSSGFARSSNASPSAARGVRKFEPAPVKATARHGREHATHLLDAPNAPEFEPWILVDAARASKTRSAFSTGNGNGRQTGRNESPLTDSNRRPLLAMRSDRQPVATRGNAFAYLPILPSSHRGFGFENTLHAWLIGCGCRLTVRG
jgi:hypothetical protein